MNKLVIIDGSSVLTRNYHGSLPWQYKMARTPEEKEKAMEFTMKSKDGQYTNAVYSMMKFLLKLIKVQQPTHMIVAWDISRDTFRRDIYPQYKGTRGETPKELKTQFPLMQEVLESCGIFQAMTERYEADDIIGTFAKKFENIIPTYIISGDRDSLQLITNKTKVWLTTKEAEKMYKKRNIQISNLNLPDNTFEFTPQSFEEEYGLKPIQIIDMKALEGDTSDNIPGVKGVGPKAAIPLLKEYGSIESIYEVIENNPEKELKKFFKEQLGIPMSPIGKLTKEPTEEEPIVGKVAALLSKKLATIVTDVPDYTNVNLDELTINLNKEKMAQKFKELDFKSLL